MTSDEVKIIADETLRFLGLSLFEIHVTSMKVVITLHDSKTIWFLYSSRAQRTDIVGAIVCELMDRKD